MFSSQDFDDLVSGRTRGLLASSARCLLWTASWPYRWVVAWRNGRFDSGRREVVRVDVPVVSVGNLTLGGTGKTPFVEWLAKWFRQEGLRVSLVSRGYGAAGGGANDEALELEQRLPDVPHVQNADRVQAANIAIDELDTQLIVLDDAFQHRRIHRDLDVVLIDALRPFGNEFLFPRGFLREPVSNIRRADLAILTRADLVATETKQAIWERIHQVAPNLPMVEVQQRPLELTNASLTASPLSSLSGKRVVAFCGIGNPAGFRATLNQLQVEVAEFIEFPDHHPYSGNDVDSLREKTVHADAELLVCTRKDLAKLQVDRLGHFPLWALTIGVHFLCGQEQVEAKLRPLVRRAAKRE